MRLDAKKYCNLAEREGFEPSVPVTQDARLAIWCLRPLGHLSAVGAVILIHQPPPRKLDGPVVIRPRVPGRRASDALCRLRARSLFDRLVIQSPPPPGSRARDFRHSSTRTW